MNKFKWAKRFWYLAVLTGQLSLRFWLIETIYFLIAYGWHWKAINEAEKVCDNIVVIGFTACLYLAALAVINVVSKILSEDKKLQMTEWISVKDKLPQNKYDFLLVTDGAACRVAKFHIDKGYWDFYGLRFWESKDVTHWMPLPKPPSK